MVRRGFTILELTVATIILATLMSVCLKWIAATSAQSRQARWRQTAACEAANLMERLAGLAWDELSPQRAASLSLSEEARQTLPGGVAAVQVTPVPGEPEARQITVAVRWRARPEMPEAELRLVAWRFRGTP